VSVALMIVSLLSVMLHAMIGLESHGARRSDGRVACVDG
jgi:hypothetical protein